MADFDAGAMVNDPVKNFVFDLHDSCRRSRIQADIDKLYNETWAELTKKYYSEKGESWPSAEAISSECGGDALFLSLYKEMAFRHLFLTGKPRMEDRLAAWENYTVLFDFVIDGGKDLELFMNEQWASDIITEFVYQFQDNCQYRTDLSSRDADEVALLQANQGAWATNKVAYYLTQLIRVSNVGPVLEQMKASGISTQRMNAEEMDGLDTPNQATFDLGYFALFGMARLECLLGDYQASLAVLAPIDVTSEHERYHKVFSCHTNLYYHMGFAYLMVRRYKDAIRSFSNVIAFIYRMQKSGALQHVPGGDLGQKMNDRMCALMAILISMTPGVKVDDMVINIVKEKYGDRIAQLESGNFNRELYENLYQKACPKFIVPSIPNYDGPQINYSHDSVRQQVDAFLKQADHMSSLAKIRSYLKLYTAISVAKLARFNAISDDDFRSELLAIKHIMSQTESEPGMAALDGKTASALDIHFFVKDEMIHVDEADRVQRHEAFFMGQVNKCEEITEKLRSMPSGQR